MAKAGEHKKVICEFCENNYIQYRSDQKYCSKKCAHRSWIIKNYPYTKLFCESCGKEFVRLQSQQKYCSKECSIKAERERRKVINGPTKGWSKGKQFVPRRTCQCCGVLFYAYPSHVRRGGGKYCSYKCHGKVVGMNPLRFPHTKTKRGHGGKRLDLDNLFLRSSWEANYARYLNFLQKAKIIKLWKYEAKTFEFENIKRGCRFYTPDFEIENIDGSIEYHEIKGYMDGRSATKLKRMRKNYPQVKLILIDAKRYKGIAEKAKRFVSNWE